jgi:hypothetical protein
MATYNANYTSINELDEARAASYESMKKLMKDVRRDPSEGIHINNGMTSQYLTSSIFPNVPTGSTKYYTTTGVGGFATTSAQAGDIATFLLNGGEKSMNIKAGCARVKAGFLAQIYNNSIIVWESKKAYKTSEKAIKVASSKIDNSIDKLFNK